MAFVQLTVIVVILITTISMIQIVNAQTVTGSVTVPSTCGLALSSSSLNYGTLTYGQTSTSKTIGIQNSGNTAVPVLISGTDWVDGATTVMSVDKTKYSVSTDNSYATKTALSTIASTMISSLSPSNTDTTTYWQLKLDLIDPLYKGTPSQTMTFTVSC